MNPVNLQVVWGKFFWSVSVVSCQQISLKDIFLKYLLFLHTFILKKNHDRTGVCLHDYGIGLHVRMYKTQISVSD